MKTQSLLWMLPLLAGAASAQYSKTADADLTLGGGVGSESAPEIATGADGSTYVSWYHTRTTGLLMFETDLQLQRLNAGGRKEFGDFGLQISTTDSLAVRGHALDVDDQGTAWLVQAEGEITENELVLHRIDSNGARAFGPAGVQVATDISVAFQPPHVLALDGGGAVVTWARYPGIELQRVDEDGSLMGSAWSIPLVGNDEELVLADVEVADDGNILALYYGMDQNLLSELRMQKYSPAGEALWNEEGVELKSNVVFASGFLAELALDGTGGAFVAIADLGLRVAHVPTNGVLAYRVVVPGAQLFQTYLWGKVVADPVTGEAIVFINEQAADQTGTTIRVQRLDAIGAEQYGTAGLTLMPWMTSLTREFRPHVVDGIARVIVHSQPVNPIDGQSILRSAGLELSDNIPLPVVTLSTTVNSNDRFESDANTIGDVVAVWQGPFNLQLRMQNVSAQGSLGPVAGTVERSAFGTLAGYSADVGGLGQSATLELDLSASGLPVGVVLGYARGASIPVAGTTVLVDLSGAELLSLGFKFGPVASWQVAIPNDASLCGMGVATQAVHFGLGQPLQLSNAVDLYLGQ